MNKKLLTTGVIGTAVSLLCCFTPVLVILLGVIGLSAFVGWLEFLVMPALGLFVALAVYAFFAKSKEQENSTSPE